MKLSACRLVLPLTLVLLTGCAGVLSPPAPTPDVAATMAAAVAATLTAVPTAVPPTGTPVPATATPVPSVTPIPTVTSVPVSARLPSLYVQQFMDACVGDSGPKTVRSQAQVCGCILDRIQQQETVDQIMRVSMDYERTAKLPSDWLQVSVACAAG